MGQVLHGSATTTEAVRRAIQHSQESLRALAKRYGINQKTVAKWKKRTSVADVPTGPKEPKSTVLTVEEEAIIVAFRRHTLCRAQHLTYPHPITPSNSRHSPLLIPLVSCVTISPLSIRFTHSTAFADSVTPTIR